MHLLEKLSFRRSFSFLAFICRLLTWLGLRKGRAFQTHEPHLSQSDKAVKEKYWICASGKLKTRFQIKIFPCLRVKAHKARETIIPPSVHTREHSHCHTFAGLIAVSSHQCTFYSLRACFDWLQLVNFLGSPYWTCSKAVIHRTADYKVSPPLR